eukprot:1329470-Amorphochlora_amoeboformis.AAC.1
MAKLNKISPAEYLPIGRVEYRDSYTEGEKKKGGEKQGYCPALACAIGFSRVLPGTTRYYPMQSASIGHCPVLTGQVPGHCPVLTRQVLGDET